MQVRKTVQSLNKMTQEELEIEILYFLEMRLEPTRT
jgi:hypothetical protein